MISTADSTAGLQCPSLPQRAAYCHPESRTHWTPEIHYHYHYHINHYHYHIITLSCYDMYLAAVPSVGVAQGPRL